jgi:hypothetical protein
MGVRMSVNRRLAIVRLQGTPNVPGLRSYVAPADPAAKPAPSITAANWIAVALVGFAAAYMLSKLAEDPFEDEL